MPRPSISRALLRSALATLGLLCVCAVPVLADGIPPPEPGATVGPDSGALRSIATQYGLACQNFGSAGGLAELNCHTPSGSGLSLTVTFYENPSLVMEASASGETPLPATGDQFLVALATPFCEAGNPGKVHDFVANGAPAGGQSPTRFGDTKCDLELLEINATSPGAGNRTFHTLTAWARPAGGGGGTPPPTAGSVVTGSEHCTVTGTGDDGVARDLLAIGTWHLRSSDHVHVTAVADNPQSTVQVSAYALGFAIPLAHGEGGGSAGASADYDLATLAPLGRVFVAGGGSSGPGGLCQGQVAIVLDDVSPLTTALGIGSIVAIVLGLLLLAWGLARPESRLRRGIGLVATLVALAGLTVLVQQTSNPGGVASVATSAFALAVPGVLDVSRDLTSLALAGLATLLIVILMPFPAELFNRTLEENLDEIKGWVRRIPLLGALVPAPATEGEQAEARTHPSDRSLLRVIRVGGFVLAAGILYSLLDPGFGPNPDSLVTFAGIVLSLVAVTWLAALPSRAAHRRLHGDKGRLEAVEGTLVIAAVCVLISRVTGFLPGYLYGLILGYSFATELELREEGRSAAAGAWWMLGLSAVCWLMLGAVRAPGVADSLPGVIAQSVLAAATVAGIEGIVFALVPIRFLPGEHVFRTSRLGWSVLYAIGLFAFIWIILNPANGFVTESTPAGLPTAIALFVGFGLVSIAFWAYFRFRPRRATAKA